MVSESLTVLTSALSSLRMALAATPVVEVLKSIWDAPRTRALKESLLGMRESEGIVLREGEGEGRKRGRGDVMRRTADLCGQALWCL